MRLFKEQIANIERLQEAQLPTFTKEQIAGLELAFERQEHQLSTFAQFPKEQIANLERAFPKWSNTTADDARRATYAQLVKDCAAMNGTLTAAAAMPKHFRMPALPTPTTFNVPPPLPRPREIKLDQDAIDAIAHRLLELQEEDADRRQVEIDETERKKGRFGLRNGEDPSGEET